MMFKKIFFRDFTESGDIYAATKEKWEEYRQAWIDEDMEKVMFLEEGGDPDFYYNPDENN